MAGPFVGRVISLPPRGSRTLYTAPRSLEKCSSYRFEEAETTWGWRSGQLSRLPPFPVCRSFWNSCSTPTPRCWKSEGVIALHDSSPPKFVFGAAAATRQALRRRSPFLVLLVVVRRHTRASFPSVPSSIPRSRSGDAMSAGNRPSRMSIDGLRSVLVSFSAAIPIIDLYMSTPVRSS